MGLRDEIQKRADRKRSEISDLQAKIRDAETYIQALEDTIRLLPRDTVGQETATDLRVGSRVAKARDFLRRAGVPQQVMAILQGVCEEASTANRAALSGSLSAYVRKGEIFTRPSPNVFGLVEFSATATQKSGPPPEFGQDERDENAPSELSWLVDPEGVKKAP